VPIRAGHHREFTGRWRLDEQHGTFTAITLSVAADRGQVDLTGRDGQVRTFSFGVGALLSDELPGYGYETLSSGAWLDEQTLYLRVHVLGLYLAQLEISVAMRGDAVTLTMKKD